MGKGGDGKGHAGPTSPEADATANGAIGDDDSHASPLTGKGHFRIQLKPFDGEATAYKEWKREVQTTALLYNISEQQLAGLIYLALASGPGKPRDLFTHYEIQELLEPGGLTEMWKVLDQEFVRETYVKADEAQARYDRCRRSPGQQMEEYLAVCVE